MRHFATELAVSVFLLVLMLAIAAIAADAAPAVVRSSRPVLRAPHRAAEPGRRVRRAPGHFTTADRAAVTHVLYKPTLVYYHYHYAPQQVGQAFPVAVKPNWRYEVQFRAAADPASGGAPGKMVGQLRVRQEGVGQPSVGARSFLANPERIDKFIFIGHPNPASPTAGVTLSVLEGSGLVEVMILELGPA